MQTKIKRGLGGSSRVAVLAAGILTLSLWATPQEAFADKRDRSNPKKFRSYHPHNEFRYRPAPRRGYRSRGRRSFTIPGRIGHKQRREYRRFYRGSFYFAPHRHRHSVYGFPVYSGFGVSYRPYTYCGERPFVGGFVGFHGPRFGFQIRF